MQRLYTIRMRNKYLGMEYKEILLNNLDFGRETRFLDSCV